MKKRSFILFASLIGMYLLSFGAASEATAQTAIRIGGSLPLTGIHAETAKWMKEGYDFWAEEVNKKGGLLGRPVKVTIYDDEGNPDGANCPLRTKLPNPVGVARHVCYITRKKQSISDLQRPGPVLAAGVFVLEGAPT